MTAASVHVQVASIRALPPLPVKAWPPRLNLAMARCLAVAEVADRRLSPFHGGLEAVTGGYRAVYPGAGPDAPLFNHGTVYALANRGYLALSPERRRADITEIGLRALDAVAPAADGRKAG